MEQIRILLTGLLLFILFYIGSTFYSLTNFAIGAPSVKYEGGRYYLNKDGERLEKYYNQDYTAKAAAANLSFECGCAITIEQPDIVVTTTYDEQEKPKILAITWARPTKRLDGTELLEDEISHYLLEVNGIEMEVYSLGLTLEDVGKGEYKMRVATILKDGERSDFTEYKTVTYE